MLSLYFVFLLNTGYYKKIFFNEDKYLKAKRHCIENIIISLIVETANIVPRRPTPRSCTRRR